MKKKYATKVCHNCKDKKLKDKEHVSGKITVYLPQKKGKYPLILISPGWKAHKKVLVSISKYIASQGYVVAIFRSKKRTLPEHWLESFDGMIKVMLNKNNEEGHILYNQIDSEQIGIIAHSIAATGGLAFSNFHSRIKAIVAIHPYNGAFKLVDSIVKKNECLGDTFQNTKAATLILTGEKDRLAYPEKTYLFFEHLNQSVPACFISFQNFKHNDILDVVGGMFFGGFKEETFILYSNFSKIWFDSFLKNQKENLIYLKKESDKFKTIQDYLYVSNSRKHIEYPNYAARNLN